MVAFVIRLTVASLESGVNEQRLKEAFLDELIPQWHLQAREVVAADVELRKQSS